MNQAINQRQLIYHLPNGDGQLMTPGQCYTGHKDDHNATQYKQDAVLISLGKYINRTEK